MSNTFVIRNAWICAINDHDQVNPVFGDLEIRDGKIQQITQRHDQQFRPAHGSAEIDAAGRMLTVPQVNFHEHIYSRLAKGLPINGPMTNFVEILESLWWKLDRTLDMDMVRASAQMAAFECLQNGVTYLFDHHASPSAVKGSLQTIAETLDHFGLRSVLSFEISDRNGQSIAAESLTENVEFIRKAGHENSKGMIGLHALFTLSDDTLREIARWLETLKTGIHIHVAEDRADVQLNQKEFKKSIARRLADFNLLNERSLLIHGVHLTTEDYRIIARSGAALVYNPDSNLNNAVGLPDYANVPESIPILMGTDGMHANVGRSLKQLFLLYRFQKNSFESAFTLMQKIFKDQLHFVRRYFPDFPGLQEGHRADFVLWNYIPPTPVTDENFFGHLIYGLLESQPQAVFQNGRTLLLEGKIKIENPLKIWQNIRTQGKRLFEIFSRG